MPRPIKQASGRTLHPRFGEFRLRALVGKLTQMNEVEVVEDDVALIDVGRKLEGNPRAVHFKSVGPQKQELVGNVLGSRRRIAAAFDVDEKNLLPELMRRIQAPIEPLIVESTEAPVQEVVLEGEEANFGCLPIHLQHALDGGPYISASIDFSQNMHGGRRNIGYRRLMMRGRKTAGVDLIAPSDMRVGYAGFLERGEPMPVAFAIGSHPADSVAAVSMVAVEDEITLIGALRQRPVPLVKCRTNDLFVPADAELVLEGYIDERGWVEAEGPYGEFLGYYGRMKTNPVFHLTAITRRHDALFQTATIGGYDLAKTDTAQICALRTEMTAWDALQIAIREPVAVYSPPSTGGTYNLRVSMRQRYPGESRNAIASIFASKADIKHVFVVDDDIDVFSDSQMEWALATRFQAERDLVVGGNFRTVPLDPSLLGAPTGAKAGFDLTLPVGWRQKPEFFVPTPPVANKRGAQSLADALREGPKYFSELVQATGSQDERRTMIDLDELRSELKIERDPEGKYYVNSSAAE